MTTVVDASGLVAALVVSRREEWASCPRAPNVAPLMQPCLIAQVALFLQAGGYSPALHAFLKAEWRCRSDFLRLANALSALIPCGVAEKRLLDAVVSAVSR